MSYTETVAARRERERASVEYLGPKLKGYQDLYEIEMAKAKFKMKPFWSSLMDSVILESEENSKGAIAGALGVTRQTLDRWVKEYLKESK